jgi:hypothetical protein
MVTAADSGNTYQLGLIDRGQLRMVYLNDNGATVNNVWRVEMDSMSTTDANAAMGTQSDLNSTGTTSDMSTSTSTSSDMNTSGDQSQSKMKVKENGVKTKIKSEDGKVKIKQKKVDD